MHVVATIIDLLVAVLVDAMDGRIDGPAKKQINKRLKKLFLRARKEFWKVINGVLEGRLSQRSATLIIIALTTARSILLAVNLARVDPVVVGNGWDEDDQAELDNLIEFPASGEPVDPADAVAAEA